MTLREKQGRPSLPKFDIISTTIRIYPLLTVCCQDPSFESKRRRRKRDSSKGPLIPDKD
jgi:hypothetical protein